MHSVLNETNSEWKIMSENNETVATGKPITVTDADFDRQVLESKHTVLVDFWAEWCGPCKMIAPTVAELAVDYAGRATVAKVDVDANAVLAGRYGIASIPSLLVFRNGQVVERLVGVQSKKSLAAKLDAHLN
jgi:thioredoxin 1